MLRKTVLTAALAAAFAHPLSACAADDKELAAIRAQIADMKASYEARLQALEARLQEAQAAPAAPVAPPVASNNAFNPAISMVLGGTMNNLSQDPARYRLQGFVPTGGEAGPGKRGFNLGESELTMAANIDPMFAGQLTFSMTGEDTLGVEEAFVQTRALSNGLNLRVGRFLSSVGYLNSQHAHAWDFVDAPLAYQAFFGGQYKPDGVQAKWLAPTDTFLELGAELGSGASFPGNGRSKNGFGAATVFVHAGDDIGNSGSWRAGLSYLRTGAAARSFDQDVLSVAFDGRSSVAVADAIYKWAPNGNPTQQNFKLQGEYFRRKESGSLAAEGSSGNYDSSQSGWYLQGVYQFMPNWRAGLRYERLDSGTPSIGLLRSGALAPDALASLAAYTPRRSSLMLDYSPSEFARLRLQVARDQSRPGVTDNQIFLQYIMSLGTHAAHAF
ncbi:MAG: TonB-dependent receptor [Pseudomonadota bacterium]